MSMQLSCGWLAAACASIWLAATGFAAPDPQAEIALPANAGITMAYYRNFFSDSMNHLLQLVADKAEPSGAVVLKSLEARDWWTQARTSELSRLYALHLYGFLVPATNGNYRFYADVRGQMRVYLSPDADASLAKPLQFGPATSDNPSETLAYNQASEPVAMQAGQLYFVRVLFIPGWQERLKILWARQTDDSVDTAPDLITAAHLRTTAE